MNSPLVENLVSGVVALYHVEREKGATHQKAWTTAVTVLMTKLNNAEMVVQMEASHRLGKTINLETGEPLTIGTETEATL